MHTLDVPDVKYSYVVVGGQTVLVEPETRKIVHIMQQRADGTQKPAHGLRRGPLGEAHGAGMRCARRGTENIPQGQRAVRRVKAELNRGASIARFGLAQR